MKKPSWKTWLIAIMIFVLLNIIFYAGALSVFRTELGEAIVVLAFGITIIIMIFSAIKLWKK